MDQSKLFKKIIIGLSLISTALFVLIYFVYLDIKAKNEKISLVEQELASKNNRYDYLVSMQKLVQDIEPDIKKIDESIISKSADVDFIENLEALARSRDLTIQIFSLNLVADSKLSSSTVSTLKIKAKAEGSWASVYTFLSELESLPFKVKINQFSIISNDNLALSRAGSLTQEQKWQATFDISVLEYK